MQIILCVLRDFNLIHKEMKFMGQVSYDKGEIYYNKNQPFYEGIDTLLHEIVHVYRDCYLGKDEAEEKDELETRINSAYWGREIFEDI